MSRFFHSLSSRLDATYRDQPHFMGVKARLLILVCLLLFAFVAMNVVKLFWLRSPGLNTRLVLNAIIVVVSVASIVIAWRGRLRTAGTVLVLGLILPAHTVVLTAHGYLEPLSAALQLFVYDLVFLLLGIFFAPPAVAFGVLAVIVGTHFGLNYRLFHEGGIGGSLGFAADTLLRDGVVTIGIVFWLGSTLMRMIEKAHSRSEEALRETRELNQNLEHMVLDRTRDLEAATARANAASQAKGEFLANMSHEIRTPLNGVIASADLLLRRGDLPPQARDQVQLVARSGDLLLKLLGDILDLSKIEAGQLELENHAFELESLVSDSVALVGTSASLGTVRLESELPRELSGSFVGDSFRLRQVLLNLMSNAVKFTPPGGTVRLTVASESRAPDSEQRMSLRFEIADTGIGMDAATLNRISERFMQADSSTTRRFGGTGLGLAISARLIELMGGRLGAESEVGRGSTFHFTIPLLPLKKSPASPSEPPRVESQAPLNLKVLVADDNEVNRRIIAAQLEQLGCTSVIVGDGEALLAELGREPLPDIILMDCHMPKLDGWAATRRIRDWSSERDSRSRAASVIPIIALTAAAMPEERARCSAAGMNGFLSKPSKLSEFRRVLAAHSNR